MIRIRVTCLCLVAAASVSDAATIPNFVIFYVDDLGWADTSVRMMDDEPLSRSDFYQTPALERLAKQGMRFSNGYAPTHQELELALVKLFRVTGKPLYLDMARRFLEIRGVIYVPSGDGVGMSIQRMAVRRGRGQRRRHPALLFRQAAGHFKQCREVNSSMAAKRGLWSPVPASAVMSDGGSEAASLLLTPYYAWNNRGVSSMTVWFPRDKALAVYDPHLLPKESAFASIKASHTSPLDTVSAIGDGKEPGFSSGKKVPRWTSRPQKGNPQWIEARFHAARQVRSVGVYWMQDRQDVWFPEEWSLEVEQNGKWKPFEPNTTDRYESRANQYNVVHPAAPPKCDVIRIRMTPKEDACVGILEVQVAFE